MGSDRNERSAGSRRSGSGRGGRSNGEHRVFFTVSPSPVELSKILGGLGKEFSSWRPVWPRVAQIIDSGVRANISSKGSSIGQTWPAYDANYLRRKARTFGRTELVRSGAMLNSIDVLSVGNKSLIYGTDIPYARAVNYNGKHGRRFMEWSNSMRSQVIDVLNSYASELLRKASERLSSASRSA